MAIEDLIIIFYQIQANNAYDGASSHFVMNPLLASRLSKLREAAGGTSNDAGFLYSSKGSATNSLTKLLFANFKHTHIAFFGPGVVVEDGWLNDDFQKLVRSYRSYVFMDLATTKAESIVKMDQLLGNL